MNAKTESQLLDLVSKVKQLCLATQEGSILLPDFVSWLTTYLQRANDLIQLRPTSDDAQQQETAERDWHIWCSGQNVVDFCEAHKLVLDKHNYWWWLATQPIGHIRGLDKSQGKAVITNGIDVWIERADGSLFKGHLDWFIKDKIVREHKHKETSAERVARMLADLTAELASASLLSKGNKTP